MVRVMPGILPIRTNVATKGWGPIHCELHLVSVRKCQTKVCVEKSDNHHAIHSVLAPTPEWDN